MDESFFKHPQMHGECALSSGFERLAVSVPRTIFVMSSAKH